ncbi:hypothetical protein ZYGR_0N04200 [Zygosaccharomyces rouxii]|uniref:ZYRO0D09944p n=2 Tax=Zygosaccharomyces rouxii TaxID=4956 RepID=C5DVW4_ZYGRC|nr:uncharacterized protein ZYRO0D09944g [Zygosaccharomyces rouxii]KAH9200843.1 hypothetical protein LQ764DRAFT_234038 [Zygosaccharomyces rouxii]GAV49015.1 hypothetical protein ZYGR_0N04200 [Zygosaccharomyces rouxii]CAR27933.1 ZYRO0D09944p [Zygosaccharomyces rouxii]
MVLESKAVSKKSQESIAEKGNGELRGNLKERPRVTYSGPGVVYPLEIPHMEICHRLKLWIPLIRKHVNRLAFAVCEISGRFSFPSYYCYSFCSFHRRCTFRILVSCPIGAI